MSTKGHVLLKIERLRDVTGVRSMAFVTQEEDMKSAIAIAAELGFVEKGSNDREVILWKFTDRDRALLTLAGKPLTNHRGLRISLPLSGDAK